MWEEDCDTYWDKLEIVVKQFRKYGLWGAAARTCSGCEDPSWLIREDDYRRINVILTAENLCVPFSVGLCSRKGRGSVADSFFFLFKNQLVVLNLPFL